MAFLGSIGKFLSGPLEPLFSGQFFTSSQLKEAGLGALGVSGFGYLSGLLGGGGSGGGGFDWNSLVGGIKDIFSGGVKDLESIYHDLTGSVESVFKDAEHLQQTTFGHFLEGVNNEITSLSHDVQNILSPITGVVNSISDTIQHFNDALVTPIANDIQATHDATQSLIKAFHTDLQGGLQGLIKLPLDITNALTSLDATWQRGQEQLGSQQEHIATDIFKPALDNSIGAPLSGMHQTFGEPVFTEDEQAAFNPRIAINENINSEDFIKAMEAFEDAMKGAGGFFGPIVRTLWGVLKMGDGIVTQVERQVEGIRQQVAVGTPNELLGVGETIEAWRRGLLGEYESSTELAKHGIDDTRIKVLYDLAQFLFGPKDAVNLRARNIIDDATLTTLMNQNNLDPGQADALTQLMQHILGPGDIAAAQAREFIDGELATSMYEAALVPPELMSIIAELETHLINPQLMIAMAGRAEAAKLGLLEESLTEAPPDDVSRQFDRTQSEQGTAALNWLAHWRIPGPEWWVDAYFRGLRTRTEVEAAFSANNVPRELWDDIFSVEEELPPVWLIPDIIASGVWSKEQAIPQFRKLGFSEANAEVLYQYGYSKSKAAKATTAADLQKVSLGNAAAAFNDGLIEKPEYLKILKEHGYSTAAATLTVELDEYKQAVSARKDAATAILDAANLGQITDTQAQSDWFSMGLTATEVNKWLLKLHKAKAAKTKHLSESQIEKLYKKGLLTANDVMSRLVVLGYTVGDAELLLALM